MFGQYLSHTNKRVTVAILQKISQVNKALLPKCKIAKKIIWPKYFGTKQGHFTQKTKNFSTVTSNLAAHTRSIKYR